jgi:hypothetical protein
VLFVHPQVNNSKMKISFVPQYVLVAIRILVLLLLPVWSCFVSFVAMGTELVLCGFVTVAQPSVRSTWCLRFVSWDISVEL